MKKSDEEIKQWLNKEIKLWQQEAEAEKKSMLYAPCARYHVISLSNVKQFLFGDKK